MSADIDALWIAMADVYGHRWVSSFGADPQAGAGATWATGLAGLTQRQIADGMAACIASSDPWPPTLPEFRAMCLGIPPLAAVRLDAAKVSPFTRLVWQNLDGYRYRSVSADQADRMLREAYELAREHVMRGGALPEAAAGEIAHEERKPDPVPPEVAAERLAKLREELDGVARLDELEPKPEPELEVPLATVEDQLRGHYAHRKTAATGGEA